VSLYTKEILDAGCEYVTLRPILFFKLENHESRAY